MDKLESMQVFVAVSQAGGFSAASRALGLPLATVSRKVAELEASLGVRLLERSTRRVALTEIGQPYHDACRRLLEAMRDADAVVAGDFRAPRGELSVTAPVGFGRQHLQPLAVEFLRTYPEIDLRLNFADRVVNLLEEQVDVALRIAHLADSSLLARPVGAIKMVVCAAPGYLQARGVPAHPSALSGHDCILWAGSGAQRAWRFCEDGQEAVRPVRVRVTATLPETAVDMARAGLGLARVTSYQAEAAVRAGELLPVLRDFELAAMPVSLVHAGGRRVPLKLRVFLDFVAPRLTARLNALAEIL